MSSFFPPLLTNETTGSILKGYVPFYGSYIGILRIRDSSRELEVLTRGEDRTERDYDSVNPNDIILHNEVTAKNIEIKKKHLQNQIFRGYIEIIPIIGGIFLSLYDCTRGGQLSWTSHNQANLRTYAPYKTDLNFSDSRALNQFVKEHFFEDETQRTLPEVFKNGAALHPRFDNSMLIEMLKAYSLSKDFDCNVDTRNETIQFIRIAAPARPAGPVVSPVGADTSASTAAIPLAGGN